MPPSRPLLRPPGQIYKYDPKKAHELLKEAGCLPCKVTLAISTSGSGQMQPLPMNELVKSQLEAVGFQVTSRSMDWNSLIEMARSAATNIPDIDGYQRLARIARSVQCADQARLAKSTGRPRAATGATSTIPEIEELIGRDLQRIRPRQAPRAADQAERDG